MRCLTLIAAAILTLIVAVVLFFFFVFRWDPFLDDGPFQGIPRDYTELSEPIQTLAIYSGNQIEVYPRSKNDPAPTVLLRTADGAVKWCIYAVGTEHTEVDAIYFSSVRRNPFARPAVIGRVDWSFGAERTLWFINENGELLEFYFSW